jgi:hypothetical protein
LIIYQKIFDPIFANNKTKKLVKPFKKSKSSSSSTTTSEYKSNKTFSQHGLLIDKYLNRIPVDEDSTYDSFLWKDFILFVFLFVFLYLICYFRDSLLKTFRERHKRSVLKYSV